MSPTPSTYEGPLHPTSRDYSRFLKFLSLSYGFKDSRWFEKDASFYFGTGKAQLATKWALKSGNEFAAHVGIFPFNALVEGRALKVAGIGAVATHPEHRGQGLMKRLMEHALQRVGREGFDLAILWGERDLYAPYGFERALYQRQFLFREKILRFYAAPHSIRPARPGDAAAIRSLFQEHPFRVQRVPAYFGSISRKFQSSTGPSVWVLESKGKVTAYSIVLRPPTGGLEIAEWGGNKEDVACLWASLLPKTKADTLNVSIYPQSDLLAWCLENSSEQTLASRACMVRILDPLKVLRVFEPQLSRRYAASGNKGGFQVDLASGDQVVRLEVGKHLRVSKATSRGISLSSGEWTTLLFGMGKPSQAIPTLGDQGAFLDFLFPLDWYWWRSDWI